MRIAIQRRRHDTPRQTRHDSRVMFWEALYRVSQKMYHICFVYSFYSFQHSQLRPTSKDSQFHGDLLTPMDSVASSWLSLSHVLELSVFLGHTALLGVWPPRPLGKSREWPQGSPVSKLPRFLVPSGAQYSSGTPQEKSGAVKSGEHGGQLTEAQREKKTPL